MKKATIYGMSLNSRKKFAKRLQRGAILLDVLIALLMGTLLAFAVCNLMVSASRAGTTARENDVATTALRQIVENIRQYKGAVVVNNTYSDATVFGSVPQLAQMPPGTITNVRVFSYRTTLKQVVATVTWRGAGTTQTGVLRRRTLTVLLAPRGVTQ